MNSSIDHLLHKAAAAKQDLQQLSEKDIKQILLEIAAETIKETSKLLLANQLDLSKKDKDDPKNDRLLLTEQRIHSIASAIKHIAALPNPAGQILIKKTLPNKLKLQKITVPMGVVAAIYESRPNVTFDIAALCFRSRNVAVLKGSSDAFNTNLATVSIIKKIFKRHKLNPDCVTLLPASREVIEPLLQATKLVDLIIPRGSDALIQYVRNNSRVPVIETGAGVCHTYVHEKANLKKAVDIVVNAKVSRPSVCNSLDTIIVDSSIAPNFIPLVAAAFKPYNVGIYADSKSMKVLKKNYAPLYMATEEDYAREHLSLNCCLKVVKNIDEALVHIARYSTRHSEAIVSNDKVACKKFINVVDAAAVYSNASTRFTDGEEFGLGAEIGISTQKLHARGPFALEKLVTEKWIVEGTGQVR